MWKRGKHPIRKRKLEDGIYGHTQSNIWSKVRSGSIWIIASLSHLTHAHSSVPPSQQFSSILFSASRSLSLYLCLQWRVSASSLVSSVSLSSVQKVPTTSHKWPGWVLLFFHWSLLTVVRLFHLSCHVICRQCYLYTGLCFSRVSRNVCWASCFWFWGLSTHTFDSWHLAQLTALTNLNSNQKKFDFCCLLPFKRQGGLVSAYTAEF